MAVRTHLVIGASGQVGHALVRGLSAAGDRVLGTYLSHPEVGLIPLDMTQPEAVAKVMAEVRPDAVWIPGAMPDVDRCERDPELSFLVNVKGPSLVLQEAAQRHIPLVYFSTDYVFDGIDGPFRENDMPHPIQIYGSHKVEAEHLLLQYAETLIVRPAWIYSDEPNPRNFVFRVLVDLKAGRPIKSARDQYNTPTPAGPLATHALRALLQGQRGVLHLAGPERMTRLALVEQIAALVGYLDAPIDAIRVSELPLAAKRPLNGGLVSQYPQHAISERMQDMDFSSLLTQI